MIGVSAWGFALAALVTLAAVGAGYARTLGLTAAAALVAVAGDVRGACGSRGGGRCRREWAMW
jgi:hypothetical protein